MKIAWLNGNPNPNFGGTEIHTVEMVKELLRRDVDLFLVCAKDSFVDKHLREVRKYYISFPNSLAVINTIRLARVLKKEKVDVIIANNGREYPNALYAGKYAGAKVVFFRHMERMKQWMVRKFVFPYVDMFFAVSERVKSNLISEGVRRERIKVIYNLVDEERFTYAKKGEKPINLLFVGKLDEGKGVFDFVKAFLELTKEREDLHAYVVGDGSARTELERFIQLNNLSEKLFLVGYTAEVEKYYKLAHICVIPSKYTEAFSRVAAEALACGCALVVSHVGGIKEAVQEGVNGYVFKAGDIQDLVYKIKATLEKWQSFSFQSLRIYREKFSRSKITEEFLKALEELTTH